eukprot:CAMPEP_0183706634 /NCGR_PEP_ID=MMETSP0737-20130205/3395_1 /TAXON_ID=385413 /ORGANISM="Thalassiosira miniscula, Strain CCMP1093" /LENGTH=257 /DNA_ID=CAMNT_0025934091 /DNA_START=195 /DNA_END=968 /DNA_ORIENTATION=+
MIQQRLSPPLFMRILAVVLLLSSSGDAFSTTPSVSQSTPRGSVASLPPPSATSLAALAPNTDSDEPSDKRTTSRRNALHQTLLATTATITLGITTLPTSPANADVTNKIAGTTALRSLSIIQTQLSKKLLPVAQSNDYVGVKQAIREPPIDGLRKNMLVVVRGGEDGPKAGELLAAYKRLIQSLENIDATASLGMRGRKMSDPFQLTMEYEEVEKALGVFIKVGAEAADIPLQENVSPEAQVGSIDVRSGKVTQRVI